MALTQVQPGMLGATQPYNFKNRIINGAMVIDQRNAGASGTASNVFTVDRWGYQASQASKGTWGQNLNSITPPVGFTNYLGFQSSSSYSVAAGDYFDFYQGIEGFNIADLGWGTANAKTVTLSFWVYSSLTGTFGGGLRNGGANYSYPFVYTISSANTWTQISVNIVAPTSGTFATNNGVGFYLWINLGTGSTYSGTAGSWAATNYLSATGATSVVGTSGATFYITGVQLELGVTATSFDYRAYGQELVLCQRYFQKAPITYGAAINTTTLGTCYDFPVVMRAVPTLALLTTTPYAEIPLTTGYTASGATVAGYSYAGGTGLTITGFTGFTSGRAPILLDNNQVSVSAEL